MPMEVNDVGEAVDSSRRLKVQTDIDQTQPFCQLVHCTCNPPPPLFSLLAPAIIARLQPYRSISLDDNNVATCRLT